MFPFYVHHLTMYYNEYMTFPLISPTSEGTSVINLGLLILEIICIIGFFTPTVYQASLGSIHVFGLVIILASIWLIVFLVMDIK